MIDSTDEMLQKQREVIYQKTPEERFLIGLDLIDFCRTIAENSIRQSVPGISDVDLKIALLKRYYRNTFSKKEMEKIINSFSGNSNRCNIIS
jgi:hypothetical protein